MKVFVHNAEGSLLNSYLVTSGKKGSGILVDPDMLDVQLVQIIESRGYYVNSVLLTNPQNHNLSGITSVKKIYHADIYSTYPRVLDFSCVTIQGGDVLFLDDLSVEVVPIMEYSRHAVMFRVGNVLFPGSVMTAGIVAEEYTDIEKLLLRKALFKLFKTLPEDLIILPSYGPPSTIRCETFFNLDLKNSGRGV
jgi:hydroxyacylglutathione hydrolase